MYRLIPLLLLALLTACTPRAGEQQNEIGGANRTPVETVNIIIGFADPEQNPEDPALIKSLETDLNARIAYLRTLSGNAALYACETPESGENLVAKLNKLGSRADINYAEPDQRRSVR